jgi:hypothetical protein
MPKSRAPSSEDSSSSTASELDEYEQVRRKIQDQLKRSKTFSSEAVHMKEFRKETKEEKKLKLLADFDNDNEERHLKIQNFKF